MKRKGCDTLFLFFMQNNHPKNDDEIVSLYEKSISKSTKLILVSHMVNITGQILPIKKICNMAHNYGVQVLVDGAHCIGHFTFSGI